MNKMKSLNNLESSRFSVLNKFHQFKVGNGESSRREFCSLTGASMRNFDETKFYKPINCFGPIDKLSMIIM